MNCLNCGCNQFREENIRIRPEIKSQEVEVTAAALLCAECGSSLMNSEQMGKLRRKAADEYRRLNSLLTSKEIVRSRTFAEMSQAALARHLHVEEPSVKQWETFFVQEQHHDEQIRALIAEPKKQTRASG